MVNTKPHKKSSVNVSRNLKGVCSECSGIMKSAKRRHHPKLFTLYKNLCKSPKCFIHKIKCSTDIKGREKTEEVNVPGTLDDFEEEMSAISNVDLSLFTKIEAAVEDLDAVSETYFKNLVGYRQIKDIIERSVIWPLKKPGIFKGLRSAPRGILLFGPPGTGKTSLGKFIAFKTNSTFFNISASTLSSKWMGDTEKLVRTLFLVAKARQPSIIFIDEIDCLLSEKARSENETTRRLKNEFLFCMSTIDTTQDYRIMVIGATSRPQELDETIRPKFLKRIYIPLPDENDRKEILSKLMECECHSLEEIHINEIVKKTEGYSVVDLKNLSQEAAMSPIKILSETAINNLKPSKIRPISIEDFYSALRLIKPTVSEAQVKLCESWDFLYGYGGEENTH